MVFLSWSWRKKKHFLLNIFWGAAIAVLLHFAHYTGIGQAVLNNAYDFLVEKDFKLNIAEAESEQRLPFSDVLRLITFTPATYAAGPGGNYWTPKDLLGRTVYKAVTQGARVVLIDFAVQGAVPQYCTDGTCRDDNKVFLHSLEQAVAHVRQNKLDTVILVGYMPGEHGESEYGRELQRIVRDSEGIIQFGSTGSFTSNVDLHTRHFRFYEEYKPGTPYIRDNGILFSVQLMAAIYYWYGRQAGQRQLEHLADLLHEDPHGRAEVINPHDPSARPYVVFHQDTLHMGISSRYLFRVAPRERIDALVPGHSIDIHALYPELVTTPHALAAWPDDGKRFSGTIVLIGSTNPAMGDSHYTPIGVLPGVYLLANGINQILVGRQLHEPGGPAIILVETIIILLAAYFFLVLDPFLAAVVLVGVLYIINTPVSLFLFHRFGIILDYWFPVVGIGLHELIADIEETLGRLLKSRSGNA